MKKILIISLFIFGELYAQDAMFIGLVNAYRDSYNKEPLLWCENLSEISKNQNKRIILENRLFHSGLKSEIVTMGTSLPFIDEDIQKFSKFLKKRFNLEYREPLTEYDANVYTKIYAIYLFDCSPIHKSILLGDYKKFGFDIVIKDIEFKPNYIVINNEKINLKNRYSYFKLKFYFIINFK
jgi:hypothetical protein